MLVVRQTYCASRCARSSSEKSYASSRSIASHVSRSPPHRMVVDVFSSSIAFPFVILSLWRLEDRFGCWKDEFQGVLDGLTRRIRRVVVSLGRYVWPPRVTGSIRCPGERARSHSSGTRSVAFRFAIFAMGINRCSHVTSCFSPSLLLLPPRDVFNQSAIAPRACTLSRRSTRSSRNAPRDATPSQIFSGRRFCSFSSPRASSSSPRGSGSVLVSTALVRSPVIEDRSRR